ncbi:MAG: fibronectin type III domain-containing protein [Eubacterium sp.]
MKRVISLLLSAITIITMLSSAGIAMAQTLPDFSSAVSVNVNSSVSDSGSKLKNISVFKIQAPTDGKLNITFTHQYYDPGRFADWIVEIYSERQQKLMETTVYTIDTELDYRFSTLGINANDVIYVSVNTNDEDAYGLSYSVSNSFVQTNGDYETENNNTESTADILAIDSSIGGNVIEATGDDWYKITAPSDGKLNITFTHQYYDPGRFADWIVEIYNARLQKLLEKTVYTVDDLDYTFTTLGINNGDVIYVRVLSEDEDCYGIEYVVSNSFTATNGEYETETNNSMQTADVLEANAEICGNIIESTGEDWFKITAPNDGKLSITFSHQYYDPDRYADWIVEIYNARQQKLYEKTVYTFDDLDYTFTALSVNKDDVIYVRVLSEDEDCYGLEYSVSNSFTHNHKDVLTATSKATTSSNGKATYKCSICGRVITKTIYRVSSIKLSGTSYTYSGKVYAPAVTVKDSQGKTLVKNTDYTVTYASGRKYVGKYAVKITLKGNYSGTKTLYFYIKPKATSISSVTAGSKKFTVKWKKQATQTTGYQIQYSTSSKFTNAKTVTISKNSTTSKTISGLSAKRKYYVRVRTYKIVNGTKYYSAWSSAKHVTTK